MLENLTLYRRLVISPSEEEQILLMVRNGHDIEIATDLICERHRKPVELHA
tara:strand:- start:1520 stop:1672 length:153 start_codon:yes stop_codon:yes gene_type:complete